MNNQNRFSCYTPLFTRHLATLVAVLVVGVPLTPVASHAQANQVCAVQPPAAQKWSDPATWGGALPASGARVVIPAGRTIALDIATPNLATVTVEGTLTVDMEKDVALTADAIVVVGGRLQIGTAARPYTRNATITLTGSDTTQNIAGMGTKLLGAMMGGKIEIFGETRTWWSQLNASAAKGATQITLKESVDWRPGERIVIASTALDPNETEERVVTAVNGNTVTLNQPLAFSHYGQLQTFAGKTLDERAEVGLLTRNIVIQGDDASVAAKFGGHIMVMGASATARETNPAFRSSAKILGVELRQMGQFDRLGRYPIHWHQNGDSTGDFITGASLHANIQRGIIVHGTDNVSVQSNVVHASIGHSFGLEDGTETGNVFQGNLGLRTKAFPAKSASATFALQNDDQAATFWIKGPSNRFVGNHAAGGEHTAYWFDDVGVEDSSKFEFRTNVAHSYLIQGYLSSDVCCAAFEKAALWFSGEEYKPRGTFPVSELTFFKNRSAMWGLPRSVGQGFIDVRISNSIFADNIMGLNSHGAKDTVIVGRSANGDSSPIIGDQGVQEYGHTLRLENVTLVNFPSGGAIAHRNCAREAGNVTALNVKLVNAKVNLCLYNTQLDNDMAIADVTGSFLGNGVPVTFTPTQNASRSMYTTDCPINAALGLRVCNGLLAYSNLHLRGASVGITRDDGVTLDAFDIDNYPFYWTTIEGRRYRLNGDVASQPTLEFTAFTKYEDDDRSRASIVQIPATSNFAVSGVTTDWFSPTDRARATTLPQLASLAALEASATTAYFHDTAARVIHLKIWSGAINRVFVDRR